MPTGKTTATVAAITPALSVVGWEICHPVVVPWWTLCQTGEEGRVTVNLWESAEEKETRDCLSKMWGCEAFSFDVVLFFKRVVIRLWQFDLGGDNLCNNVMVRVTLRFRADRYTHTSSVLFSVSIHPTVVYSMISHWLCFSFIPGMVSLDYRVSLCGMAFLFQTAFHLLSFNWPRSEDL